MNMVIKRSKRRKRLCLQYCPYEGLSVLAPAKIAQNQIDFFVEEHQQWIKKQVNNRRVLSSEFKDFQQVYYLGEPYAVCTDTEFQSSLGIVAEDLTCTQTRKESLKAAFKKKAKILFAERLSFWVERSGLEPKALQIKWLKSRWGSCSIKKNVNLNVALIGAPLFVIDYVIVHELCHLKEMNHSPRFWALLHSYYPDIKKAKMWLKQHQVYLMLICQKDATC